MSIYGLADCNNFFVSCERVFRPALEGRPAVVLSSNDGCIVARSDAAKALGVKMAQPAFQAKELIDCRQRAPWTGGRELLDLGARLRSLSEAPELPAPAALRGELRPYQRAGYGWLRALSDRGFGGMLAGDMGLGKTVQALALLAHRHLEEKTDRPSFVVVPTSLVGNWKREAARFVPDLKLLVLHGPDRRQRFSEIPNHHLVLTTYPLLNRDHEALLGHDYDTAIGAVQIGRSGVYFRAVYAQAPLVDQPCGQSRLQGSIALLVRCFGRSENEIPAARAG